MYGFSDVFYNQRFLLIHGRMLQFDFFLEFHQSFNEGLGTWRAARNVDIDRDEIVDALQHGVGAIHPTGRSASTHGDAPFWLGHLIPHAFHRKSHFVSHGASDDHDVGLAWREAHDFHAEAGDVETGRSGRHQLDRAAGKSHRHRPERVLSHPVDRGIDPSEDDVALDLGIVGGVGWDSCGAFHGAAWLVGKMVA